MVSHRHSLDIFSIDISIRINVRINSITILGLNFLPNLHTTHPFILLFKLSIHLPTNTNLLYSHIYINLHTILVSASHWSHLTTNVQNLASIHATNLLLIHLHFNMLTYLLVELHTSNLIINPIIKCLFSLHTCINLHTNILLSTIHLPHWVNIPTNILGTTKLLPSNLPTYLSLISILFATPVSKLLTNNQSDGLTHNIPLPLTLIIHLESMPYFLEVITHNTMHLAPNGHHWTQESTST